MNTGLVARPDAVVGDERRRIWKVGRNARGRDGVATFDAGGDFKVQVKQLLKEIFLGGKAIGGQDGGVERGVSVFERVLAGEFERAIDGAEAAFEQGAFPIAFYLRMCRVPNKIPRIGLK